MPLTMMVNSSDSVNPAINGPDGQRRFRLTHEDARRDVKRFSAARTHHLLHHDRKRLHHPLHDAEIVENREKRRDEDDDGEDLEGEYGSHGSAGSAQCVAENEGAAILGVTEHGRDRDAGGLE